MQALLGILFAHQAPDRSKPPAEVACEAHWRWQVSYRALLHALLGYPKQFGNFSSSNENVIAQLGQLFQNLIVSIRSCHLK